MGAPVPTGYWTEYVWIVICGALASFFMAWGIGANDVANAFATSVGSRTLKLWQACIIAGIFEFVGAMVLGGETTKTISSDIANVNMFQEFPELYMYGMLCALAVAGGWILLATYWCMAVSTTHSIIGAVMGFSLVYGGGSGVIWSKQIGSFPFVGGFLPVILSWFFSPIIGGILSAIVFLLTRHGVLRRQNSTKLAIWTLPIIIFITIFINLLFVLAKGSSSQMKKRWPCTTKSGYKGIPYTDCSDMYNAAAWISAAVAGGLAVICGAAAIPLLIRKVNRDAVEAENAALPDSAAAATADGPVDVEKMAAMEGQVKREGDHVNWDGTVSNKDDARYLSMTVHEVPKDAGLFSLPMHYSKRVYTSMARQVVKGLFFDVHGDVANNESVQAMHAAAEVFKPETEKIFQIFQVITSCCVAFAHGSNDVANAIGPFSAIYTTYQTYKVPTKSTTTPKWIFAMGGVGLVIGLLTYGYNIIMTLGVNLLKLTPSRGYSAELGAGLTISLASFYGIPVSTTQIIVGCETGVGLCESITKGANWKLLLYTFLGWIWTILLALSFCGALFSMGAYAPSIIMSQQISEQNYNLYQLSNGILTRMKSVNDQFKSAPYWTDPTYQPYNGSTLDVKIKAQNASYTNAMWSKGYRQYMNNEQAMYWFGNTLSLQGTWSNYTMGGVDTPVVAAVAGKR